MVTPPVEVPREAIAAFCERNHIRKLSLFGSVLTERLGEESDIDMLVEFEPGRSPGFLEISRMERELLGMLGRKVDLNELTAGAIAILSSIDSDAAVGPGFVNTDSSVIKHFVPREGMRIEFRTEFFNLFNHPQFGAPGGNAAGADFNSPTFAVVNYTVNNPRLVQFALKLKF